MVKDYSVPLNDSSNGKMGRHLSGDSEESSMDGGDFMEDMGDPMTPTSLSSSQGYDSAGSDFVDIETTPVASSLNKGELSLRPTVTSTAATTNKFYSTSAVIVKM